MPSESESESEYDVFISYSNCDKAWVRGELLKRIEQVGLKAFIDFRDFTRGAPSIKEMERGVVNCRKTLLILTPDYIESEWCELEGVMAQTLSPANRDLRLIPLLKAECKKPLRIGGLTHIDFTDGADVELAWRQLLTALGRPPEPEPPPDPQRDEWFLAHPYPMPPNFTGRVAERAMLTRWLDSDAAHPLLSLRALGGFGKSALAWHWLNHDVAPAAWPRVVWWSFYEGDASFDHFLAETLHYLSGGKVQPDKLSAKDAVTTLLEMLHASGTLLVLDGFERVLRAFGGLDAAYQGDEAKPEVPSPKPQVPNPKSQVPNPKSQVQSPKSETNDRDCISPLAESFLYHVALHPNLGSKVLLTTRLCPHVLEARGSGFLLGCREEELLEMQPVDAVEFFLAQGIRGTHTEIEQACEPYGYHPLSLCLLAGLIVGDFEQPGDMAAAKRLDVSGDLVQRQHHVLKVAYESLTPERRALLGRIACFRSPVKYEALKALALAEEEGRGGVGERGRRGEVESGSVSPSPSLPLSASHLDAGLRDLVARGLLHHDTKQGRFDLHPIVRRYAYDRLAAPDRAAAHTRLRDYFAAVPKPDKVTRLEDLAPVIELYHHTVRAGQFDEAWTLFRDRLDTPSYYQFGAYHLQIDLLRALFPDGEDRPPRLKDENAQGSTLNDLACVYSLSGQPRRAVLVCEQAGALAEKVGNKKNLAIGLGNVADDQLKIGALRAAEANLRRSIALCREIEDEFNEAVGHQELGRLLAYRGAYAESETELATALKMFEKQKDVQAQGIVWAYLALRELLRLRHAEVLQSPIGDRESATPPARRALELADETARTRYPHECDYVCAHWLLGAAHRLAGQPDEADRHLHEALQRCRRINLVDTEADILIDLARLRAATGAPDEARRLAEEALVITERSGYVLQGADARLELAKLALARGDQATALEHAKEARRLATCDGPPDYTYKAAYDEAGALLAKLESHREGSGDVR
jgi:tetratricopeptide (TPR) repeat protein